MRKLITLGRRHGSQDFEPVVQPHQTVKAHRAFIKSQRAARASATYAEIWVCKPVRKLKLAKGEAAAPAEPPQPRTFKTVAQAAIQRVRQAVSPEPAPAPAKVPIATASRAFQRTLQQQAKGPAQKAASKTAPPVKKEEKPSAAAPAPAAQPQEGN